MNEREILEQSISEHKQAIAKAEEGLKELEIITYSIGDRFIRHSVKSILVRTETPNTVSMVTLDTGQNHLKPFAVGNQNLITPQELNHICNCNPTRYWDNRKKVSV